MVCDCKWRGGVAQLVRVPPCHGGCCGFESRLSRHFFCLFSGRGAVVGAAFTRLSRSPSGSAKLGILHIPVCLPPTPRFAGKPLLLGHATLGGGCRAAAPHGSSSRSGSAASLLVESRLSRHFFLPFFRVRGGCRSSFHTGRTCRNGKTCGAEPANTRQPTFIHPACRCGVSLLPMIWVRFFCRTFMANCKNRLPGVYCQKAC